MDFDGLTKKKNRLDGFSPLPDALKRNLEAWLRIELTHTSNALEGNTLTRNETALVVEKGVTVGGKSLVEHLEAVNHADALDWVRGQIRRKVESLAEADILHIHGIILRGIDDENAGCYRSIPVRVSGSASVFPNPLKVPDLMVEFVAWLKGYKGQHPVALAAEAHYRLVAIHPFVDGNGRTARLLMNMILMMAGYPPAIIRMRDRLGYINALEKGQSESQSGGQDYFKLIGASVNRSLDIYLKAVMGGEASGVAGSVASGDTGIIEEGGLLKIGELARRVGENNSTIRHWTKAGLLEVADFTGAGYQLYALEMIGRVGEIKRLKKQRLTLREIRVKIC